MTSTATVRQVIRYLGIVAVLLVLGVLWLAHELISKGHLTTDEVTLLTPLVGLASASVATLGTLLVHTGSVDPAPTPEQVGAGTDEPEVPEATEP